jgi:multidrug efflux system membrane fusion protein
MRAGTQLTVEAWSRDSSQKLSTGKLSTIDNQIDQTTGTVRLRAQFDNSDNELFPNQFVNIRLLVQEKTGVVLVNSAGVQMQGTRSFVWLLKPDSTVTVRDITVGTVEGSETEVTSGLQAGDQVVMTGVDKLQEGLKVNAQAQGEGGRGGRGAGKNAPNTASGAAPAADPNTHAAKKSGGKKGGGTKQ